MNKKIINSLTVSRIILGLLFAYIVLFNLNRLHLLIVFILCAISDFVDGKLAKKYNLESDFGAKLDVMSDFIFIIASTLSLVLIDLMPFWFLFAIAIKLLEFFMTSHFHEGLYYDRFGHGVALMFYILPIVGVFVNSRLINEVLCIFVTLCALISSILRIYYIRFYKNWMVFESGDMIRLKIKIDKINGS